ncbi:DVU_1551 family NTP transferase [Petroclostridium sp. X23]|uniref:DVU_1551 family NTP transferase n=1 Tax=Petroclostridium sp. X23 TaxID=3045146 RepID=UPI0024AE12FE|nr:NTP transferase domain-containing protein [Petroclostridium sp. X23]WHH58654.1 NTP transferase domain-containing protein [Petroclostridium sp. X23]
MRNDRIASIIVSAGYSSRMGSFKPLLKFGETTAVEMVVNAHKSAGIDEIIVVTGHKGCEVAEKLNHLDVRCVPNESYRQGMFSSVWKGVETLDTDIAAFFLHPVDIPLVKRETVEMLKSKYIEHGKGILYPEFCGDKGHPPLIDCKYKKAILDDDGYGGLKKILENFADDALCVPVFDESVLMDMDTPEDYERLLEYFYSGAPSRKECHAIMNHYNIPKHIVSHCIQVAGVSNDILNNLKRTGCELDRSALEAAALLHDIARKERNHAKIGGKIIEEIGYKKVGAIIATHTDIKVDEDDMITENEILYLADKLVKEDKVVALKDRFALALKAYGDHPEVLMKIKNRWDAANKIIRKIEKRTGRGFHYG